MENHEKHKPITPKTGILPKKAYDEFKEIISKEFGYEPTQEEVVRGANNLIGLFRLFSKPEVRTKSGQSD